MNLRKLLLPIAFVAAAAAGLQSCNEESNSTTTIASTSSVCVNGFSLKADSKVLSGLDSVFFSIDLTRGIIFNADSLPKGTKTTALIPIISLPTSVTSAKIVMEGGSHRTGEVDYTTDMSDSIDFSGRVTLILGSAEGTHKIYSIKVNVHNVEPDSLWWGSTAFSKLPTRLDNPTNQRTVQAGERTLCLSAESDGTYTLASTTDPFSGIWEKRQVAFPFTPKTRTLTCAGDELYLLSTEGDLYKSADGENWTDTGKQGYNLLGGYNSTLLYLDEQSDGLHFASFPERADFPTGLIPEAFPVSNFTNFHTIESEWWSEPMGMLFGGRDKQGNICRSVWAFDGSAWANIAANDFLPQLEGAVLLPYFAYRQTSNRWIFTEHSVLMLLGGRDSEGTINRDIYISFDNGVNWSLSGEMMNMPDFIPGLWDLDGIVATTSMTGNYEPTGWTSTTTSSLPGYYKVDYSVDGYDVSWECPYIYLFGGREENGRLSNSIWRGVIRRLTFIPVI